MAQLELAGSFCGTQLNCGFQLSTMTGTVRPYKSEGPESACTNTAIMHLCDASAAGSSSTIFAASCRELSRPAFSFREAFTLVLSCSGSLPKLPATPWGST